MNIYWQWKIQLLDKKKKALPQHLYCDGVTLCKTLTISFWISLWRSVALLIQSCSFSPDSDVPPGVTGKDFMKQLKVFTFSAVREGIIGMRLMVMSVLHYLALTWFVYSTQSISFIGHHSEPSRGQTLLLCWGVDDQYRAKGKVHHHY